jgi:hypothetical protein
MTERFPIPDAETRRKEVERLRESNRQLELFNLELDELIAMVETDLRGQRRERLEKRAEIALKEVGE